MELLLILALASLALMLLFASPGLADHFLQRQMGSRDSAALALPAAVPATDPTPLPATPEDDLDPVATADTASRLAS